MRQGLGAGFEVGRGKQEVGGGKYGWVRGGERGDVWWGGRGEQRM